MEFFDWTILGTYTGATLACALVTQLIKALPGISKIPTQAVSYVVAAIVLVLAMVFGEGFNAPGLGLALINAALVSLAANGGYAAIDRIREGLTKTDAE